MTNNKTKKDSVESQIDRCSKQIGYIVNEFTIAHLAEEMRKLLDDETGSEDSMFSIPDYQREFVWEQEPRRISRFIESIIMGLPIPFIFFYESSKTGKLEIIDGSQRMRSIYVFIHKNYELSELDRLTELNGKRFSDLSESRQRKIRNKTIRGIALSEHADKEARRDLFDRINTGSRHAAPAEIRRGLLQGAFMQLVIDLARDSDFVAMTPVNETKGMTREREELVTRFFAYGDGLEDYKGLPARFLDKYVEKKNKEFSKNATMKGEYKQRFLRTMSCIREIFPDGFRKTNTAKKITRVRFESIAVGTWWAIQDKNGDASLLIRDRVNELLADQNYQELLRADAGNIPKKLKARIEFVRKHLTGG